MRKMREFRPSFFITLHLLSHVNFQLSEVAHEFVREFNLGWVDDPKPTQEHADVEVVDILKINMYTTDM